MKNAFNIECVTSRWSHLGITQKDSAIFIGGAQEGQPPYFHYFFPSLHEVDLLSLEDELGLSIHSTVRDFYLTFNGFNLFRGSLLAFGVRKSYDRGDLSAVILNPYDVVIPTLMARNSGFRDHLCISQYQNGDRVYIAENGAVKYTNNSNITLKTWENILEWFEEESRRMSNFFDLNGRILIDPAMTAMRSSAYM